MGTAVENSWKSLAAPDCSHQNMVPGAAMAADTSVCGVQAGSAASWAENSLLRTFSAFYLLLRYPIAEPSPTSATTNPWVATDASSAQEEVAMKAAAVCQQGHGLGGGCHWRGLSHTPLPVAPRGALGLGSNTHLPSLEASLGLFRRISKKFSQKLPRGEEELAGCSTAVTTAIPLQSSCGNWKALLLPPLTPSRLDTGATRHREAEEKLNREGS